MQKDSRRARVLTHENHLQYTVDSVECMLAALVRRANPGPVPFRWLVSRIEGEGRSGTALILHRSSERCRPPGRGTPHEHRVRLESVGDAGRRFSRRAWRGRKREVGEVARARSHGLEGGTPRARARCGAVTEQGARRAQAHVGAQLERSEEPPPEAHRRAGAGLVEEAVAAAAIAAAAALRTSGVPLLRQRNHV